EPVRSPRSTLKKVLPFDAVFDASFLTTSRLVKARLLPAGSAALRSRMQERLIASDMWRCAEDVAGGGGGRQVCGWCVRSRARPRSSPTHAVAGVSFSRSSIFRGL